MNNYIEFDHQTARIRRNTRNIQYNMRKPMLIRQLYCPITRGTTRRSDMTEFSSRQCLRFSQAEVLIIVVWIGLIGTSEIGRCVRVHRRYGKRMIHGTQIESQSRAMKSHYTITNGNFWFFLISAEKRIGEYCRGCIRIQSEIRTITYSSEWEIIAPQESYFRYATYFDTKPGSTDDNYARAIAILDNEYDRLDQVISALYHRIEAVPKAGKTVESQLSTYYTLEGLLSALAAHNQPIDDIPLLRDEEMSKYALYLVRSICRHEFPELNKFQRMMVTTLNLHKSLEAAANSVSNSEK